MASTGPLSRPRHDPPPERPQKVLRARAPRHLRGTAHRRHSKGPPRVGTVPGPLPTSSAAGLGPDQCKGSRLAAPTSPEGREAIPWRWTDVGRGGGRLWRRGIGRGCRSPVQRQTTLDLHHSAGRAPAGTGLEGLGKPGQGHTAQDCASQGLGIAEATDGRWLYQLEAPHPGVDCRWHRTQGHQPSGPGRTCRATALRRAAGAWLARPATGLCRVRGHAQACQCQPWTGEEQTPLAPDLQRRQRRRWHAGGGRSHQVRAISGWRRRRRRAIGRGSHREPAHWSLGDDGGRQRPGGGLRDASPQWQAGSEPICSLGVEQLGHHCIMPTTTENKNKNKKGPTTTTTTKPDLRQRYRRAGG